jgi:hypothetical protein
MLFVLKPLVGAAAIAIGPKPWSDKIWMSGGHSTFEAATEAAINQCRKDSRLECRLAASNAHGVIVAGIDTQSNLRAVSEQSLELARKDVNDKCAALNIACTITVIFDVATQGTQIFDAFAIAPRTSQ